MLAVRSCGLLIPLPHSAPSRLKTYVETNKARLGGGGQSGNSVFGDRDEGGAPHEPYSLIWRH